ncbi:MAG: YARHG domain-containing protein [Paludibacteraceae bacterium]|nr:YARHG domain-containing protein [Paludibacteraceae bacterium]
MKQIIIGLLALVPLFLNAAPTETSVTTETSSEQGRHFSVEDYDWISYEYVSGEDIYMLTNEQIDLLRNYIYAKHGYIFKTDYYRRYFSQFRWYRPRYKNVDNMLNKVEQKNVLFLRQYTKGR